MSNRPMTSGGALKAIIEAGGLRLPAYRDRLPPAAALPCVTIDDDVTSTPERDGDSTDPAADHGESEILYVHLWQPVVNRNRRPGERFSLARDLTTLLRNCPPFTYGPADAPTRVYGLRIDGRVRIIDEGKGDDPDMVHTTLTVTMRRDA